MKQVTGLFLGLLLQACSFGPPPVLTPTIAPGPTLETIAPLPAPTIAPTLSKSSTALPTPVPRPSPTAILLLPTGAPLNFTNPSMTVLAQDLTAPDDLALAPDGSIYISDIGDGTIKRLSPDGSLQIVLSGLSEPEGMVFLPDGSMVIAEQGKNRLVRYNHQIKTLALFYTLQNNTGQAGLDGIVLDANQKGQESLIVPDSPNGALLRLSLDGKQATTQTSGLQRPTGAWVEPDGSILITDENAGSLLRVHPDGSLQELGRYSIPDDVSEDSAGDIFLVSIGDHALHVIPAATHQDIILSNDFSSPQGLAFDRDGNLLVTDPGNHRLVKIKIKG